MNERLGHIGKKGKKAMSGKHGTIWLVVILALVVGWASVSPIEAAVLFSDTFDRADNGDINIGASANQSGTYAGTPYIFHMDTSVTPNVEYETVAIEGNRLAIGRIAGGSNTSPRAGVDHNFTDASILTDGGFTIDVDVTPVTTTYDGVSRNMTIIVGATRAGVLNNGYMFGSRDQALGINITSNADADAGLETATVSVYRVTGTVNPQGTESFSYVFDTDAQVNESYHVTATIRPVDGTFAANSAWTLELAVNGTLIPLEGPGDTVMGFTWPVRNPDSNYIALERYRDPVGFWDNFTIATIPEPATLSLLALGGVGVLIRRRR